MEPGIQEQDKGKVLEVEQLADVLKKITDRLALALENHPEARGIVQGEVKRDSQMTESVPTKDTQNREWVEVFSHIPDEINVKSHPVDDAFQEEGIYMAPWEQLKLEYRVLKGGKQLVYTNTATAAEKSLEMVGRIEARFSSS